MCPECAQIQSQRKVRGGMNTKNDVDVMINGKQYTLCGYESNEYLQRIANHINDKFAEFKRQEGYNRLDVDMRSILLAINLSDDYFKAQKFAEDLQQQKEEREKEIFEMKHELISRQEEIEKLKKELVDAKKAGDEAERENIRLETELAQKKVQEQAQKKELDIVLKREQALAVKREQELAQKKELEMELQREKQMMQQREQELVFRQEQLLRQEQEPAAAQELMEFELTPPVPAETEGQKESLEDVISISNHYKSGSKKSKKKK